MYLTEKRRATVPQVCVSNGTFALAGKHRASRPNCQGYSAAITVPGSTRCSWMSNAMSSMNYTPQTARCHGCRVVYIWLSDNDDDADDDEQFLVRERRDAHLTQTCLFVSLSFFSLFFSLTLCSIYKMKYTFISVPALGDKQNTYLNIKGKLTEYAQVYKMNIPDFKVRFCTGHLALTCTNVVLRLALWMP